MNWSRRRVLQAGSVFAGVSAAVLVAGTVRSQNAAAAQVDMPRRIALLNLHLVQFRVFSGS